MTRRVNRSSSAWGRLALIAALGLTISGALAPAARAEAKLLQICQRLLGDSTTCDAVTAWEVDKVADTPNIETPAGSAATYTITVTEGATRYALGLSTVLTLTGLMPEGTRVRGLVASIQKGDGQGHFTTVASAGFGDTTTLCSCPFVDSGELSVTLRTIQGDLIPGVEGSVMEFLGYGEDVQVEIGAAYDLSSALIRPGEPVRISTCVNYAPGDAPEDATCIADGGDTRSVKACTPFDFDGYAAPSRAEVTLDERLGTPTDALVKLSKFMAIPLSGPVTPAGPRYLVPGSPTPTTWSIAPSGAPGATSVFRVQGTLTCQPIDECSRVSGTTCLGSLDNAVDLHVTGGPPLHDSARIDFSCPRVGCTPGEADACDDQNPCTIDACDPLRGCTNTPRTGSCSDGDLCTFDDTCVDGQCRGTPRRCSDANDCTLDRCDPALGCLHEPLSGGACDDRDVCTTGETCVAGACVGSPVICTDDGNPCTAEWCDPQLGCQSAPITGPCDDGNACTVGDRCEAGVCRSGAPTACEDDGNPCTAEVCDPQLGCQHLPLSGVACDDGDACTAYDACVAGQCQGGVTVRCDDGQSCTVDTCEPATGCVFTPLPESAPCDDGNGCTTNDRCQAGTCQGDGLRCDDGNPCTDDVCDEVEGCRHVPNDAPCSDGSVCTVGDQCAAGACVAGPPLDCDDGNACTIDACSPTRGCSHQMAPDGASCDSQSECTGCPWPEANIVTGYDVLPAHREGSLTSAPADYVLWFAGLFGPGYQVRMTGGEGLHLLIRDDGSAVVRGPVTVFDAGGAVASHTEWDLVMELAWRGVGAAGQGTGGPHRELPAGQQGFEYTDLWKYWSITNGMLTTPDDPAEWIYLQERPAGAVFPLQLGERANNRNYAFGASAWFTFYRHLPGGAVVSGAGDINVELAPVFCEGHDTCLAGVCQLGGQSPACAPIAVGDYCTWTPLDLAAPCDAAQPKRGSCTLQAGFSAIATDLSWCPGAPTGVTLGFTGGVRRSDFTSAAQIIETLPGFGSGMGEARPEGRCHPTEQHPSAFGGELTALLVNVRLSDARVSPAPRGLPLGDLVMVGGPCGGYSVRAILQRAETLWTGKGKVPGGICAREPELRAAMSLINANFRSCGSNDGNLAAP